MDGTGWQGRNGGSIGGARRQDDALGFWWEAVPPLCLLFCLALGGNDWTERFGCMQPGRHVGKNARETQVFLWGRRGRLWEVYFYPSLELDARALVRAKVKWCRDNLSRFDGNSL